MCKVCSPKTKQHKSKIRESTLARKARERELAVVGDVLGGASPSPRSNDAGHRNQHALRVTEAGQ
jgi:hypothetical protein